MRAGDPGQAACRLDDSQQAISDRVNYSELVITADGCVRMIYSEQFDARSLGQVTIERGSHVEPTAGALWTADLFPVGGPRLGPFQHRSEALAAEVAWLRQHWLDQHCLSGSL